MLKARHPWVKIEIPMEFYFPGDPHHRAKTRPEGGGAAPPEIFKFFLNWESKTSWLDGKTGSNLNSGSLPAGSGKENRK